MSTLEELSELINEAFMAGTKYSEYELRELIFRMYLLINPPDANP